MTRKHYSAALKAQVAIEVIHGEKTLSQLGLPTYLRLRAPCRRACSASNFSKRSAPKVGPRQQEGG